MEKPDFESIKTLIGTIGYLDKTFDDIFAEGEEQQRRIKAACSKLAAEKAKDALDEISVEELKNSKAGIRVSALRDAGFTTLGQIARAPEDDIQDINGIGEKQIEALRRIVTEFANSLSSGVTIVLDENCSELITDIYRYIRRLDNESERIVLMTGTPLENKVDEMCNLIDFVRPDMTAKVREMALLSHVPEFREVLAPVYLRRTREQVLKELPPIDEEYEWCEMTDEDSAFYSESIRKRSFQDMRRVGFQLDDLSKSAKAQRLLELCDEARAEGRKVVIYSYFRETISKVERFLGDKCVGVISGDTRVESRQDIVDRFGNSEGGSILLCQIIAGGVGLNIQAASMVIFCEPQVKPSLTSQALSRVYRMGQVRNVTVYHLLCPYSIDEAMMDILEEKQIEFDNFANESAVAGAFDNLMDKEWIQRVIEEESRKQANQIF